MNIGTFQQSFGNKYFKTDMIEKVKFKLQKEQLYMKI